MHVFVQAGALGLSHRPRRAMVVALGHTVSIIRHMPHEVPASHAGAVRGPQSAQSLPRPHEFNSEPGPPSSQMPSDTELHSLVQTVRRDPHGGQQAGGARAATAVLEGAAAARAAKVGGAAARAEKAAGRAGRGRFQKRLFVGMGR